MSAWGDYIDVLHELSCRPCNYIQRWGLFGSDMDVGGGPGQAPLVVKWVAGGSCPGVGRALLRLKSPSKC